jgi:hypothetical protein
MIYTTQMNDKDYTPLCCRFTEWISHKKIVLFQWKSFMTLFIFVVVILCWNGNTDEISATGTSSTKTNEKAANEKVAPPMILVDYPVKEEEYKDKGIVYMGCAIFEKGAWRKCPEDSPPTGYDTVSFTYMDAQNDFFRSLCRLDNPNHFFMEDTFYLLFKNPPQKTDWPAAAIISKPVWSSPLKKAVNPPSVEELSDRMKAALQPEENKLQRYLKSIANSNYYVHETNSYDPARLLPPKMTTALEFEVAPGEGAYFVILCREFPKESANPDCPSCYDMRASYWAALLRKDGLGNLCSFGWIYDPDSKNTEYVQLMGVADINGDGITDILLFEQGYERFDYSLYGYKDKHLFTQLDIGFGGY